MNKKVQLKTIVNPDFAWAISKIITYPLPVKASYWLAKIFKKVQNAERDFNDARISVLRKYAKHDVSPDGKTPVFESNEKTKEYVWLEKGDKELFIKEMEELQQEEVEIPTIQFDLLGDNLSLEPSLLVILGDVILQDDPSLPGAH